MKVLVCRSPGLIEWNQSIRSRLFSTRVLERDHPCPMRACLEMNWMTLLSFLVNWYWFLDWQKILWGCGHLPLDERVNVTKCELHRLQWFAILLFLFQWSEWTIYSSLWCAVSTFLSFSRTLSTGQQQSLCTFAHSFFLALQFFHQSFTIGLCVRFLWLECWHKPRKLTRTKSRSTAACSRVNSGIRNL